MKSYKFLKISILLISLLFFVHLTNSILKYQDNSNFKGDTLESIRDLHNLKHSSYWTLPNIHIANWTATDLTYDWCDYKNGYFIIENLTITGVDGKNGIHIENTTENFIIRNCQVSEGISLLRISNGHFINNTISFGQAYPTGTVIKIGIYMGHCFNSTIKNNFINGTTDWLSSAIMMYNCTNIIIDENTLSSNDYSGNIQSQGLDIQGVSENIRVINNTIFDNDNGIRISQSYLCDITENRISNSIYGIRGGGDNHTISNNTIKNSIECGIYSAGFNNSIFNNKLYDNKIGIEIKRASYNIVSNNSIQDNNDYGLYLEESNYNIISNNTIQKSQLYGIYLESSNHSLLSGNLITFKIGCIKEINCYGNIIRYNICQKIPSSIGGYYPWMVLGVLIITMSIILKIKLKEYN